MVEDKIAHIIISSFSTDTYNELLTAIEEMESEGMKALVLGCSSKSRWLIRICD